MSLSAASRAFLARRDGNVAILFALCILILLGGAGIAIDYVRGYSEKSKAQQAADGAILAGIRKSQEMLGKGETPGAAKKSGEDLAVKLFRSEFGARGEFKPLITIVNGAISGDAVYNNAANTTLLAAIGIKKIDVKTNSRAEFAPGGFVEISIVVDNSSSLGVGATDKDIQILANNVSCAFGCHTPKDHLLYWNMNIADWGRDAGATLRIDVVKQSVLNFLNDLETLNFGSNISVAYYTFSNSLQTVNAPTSDLAAVKANVMKLDITSDWLQGGTNFSEMTKSLSNKIGVGGDGSSPAKAEKYVILITDGVATNVLMKSGALNPYNGVRNDFAADPNYVMYAPTYNGGGAWSMQGFDPRVCDNLKNVNKAQLYTLNVEYRIPKVGTDNDTRFATIENSLKGDIDAHLAECASSPDMHFLVQEDRRIYDKLAIIAAELRGRMLRITR